MPAMKGLSSPSISSSTLLSTTAAPLCVSVSVSPWPGKCFRQFITPASWKPCTALGTSSAAWSKSSLYARSPMTVFSGLVQTSATGA